MQKWKEAWSARKVAPVPQLLVSMRKRGEKDPLLPIPVPDVRLDATAHWMIMAEKKGRCKVPGCTGAPKAKCRKM